MAGWWFHRGSMPLPRPAKSPTGSKTQGAGMTDHDLARVRGSVRADLAERRLRLLDQEIDDVTGAAAAERAEAPQERLAGERRLRAERERARHIGAAANAGIHHHGDALADRARDRGKHVDRRRQRLDLAAAVV